MKVDFFAVDPDLTKQANGVQKGYDYNTKPMTVNDHIEEEINEFEKRWHDPGDERYGLVKHNNTLISRQMNWLRDSLQSVAQIAKKEALERVNEVMEKEKEKCVEEFDKSSTEPRTTFLRGRIVGLLDARVIITNEIEKAV